jgi:hypothetical protein
LVTWAITPPYLNASTPALGAPSVLEEIPCLDDVSFWVLEIDGAVTAVVLDRSLVVDVEVRKTADKPVKLMREHGQCEVHMTPALVPKLLLAAGPHA